jgi:hypothetical protein
MADTTLAMLPMDLPSRGVLYRDRDSGLERLPGGKIHLRKMTTEEEAVLLSQGQQGLERIAKIVTNCVRLPESAGKDATRLTPADFLLTDRMATLLALRTLTFRTPFYTYTYRCQFCNQTAKATVNLAEDLEERNPETIADRLFQAGKIKAREDFTLAEPLDLHLPDCDKDIQVRFLRGHDEERIAKRAKRIRMATNDTHDQSHIFRMALQIVTIAGEEPREADREEFVRKLSGEDSAHWRIAVDDVEPGLDLSVYPTCGACGADSELSLPFTAEFFRPTSLQPR